MRTENKKGLVTNIQRYSVHDGPGIRTTVFLKGCNMHCAWCHNPETISMIPEVIVDQEKCIHCGKCDEGCYSGARREVGKWIAAEAVVEEILIDKLFYGEKGGVTISGGEPTVQPDFVTEIFSLSRKQGIHCAMESNLFTSKDILKRLLPKLDLLMCDLKIWDNEIHKYWTGVSNQIIKDNMALVNEFGLPMIVRIPVVKGINDHIDNIVCVSEFLEKFDNVEYLEFLPYHELGLSKQLESGHKQQRFEKPSQERLVQLANEALKKGLKVKISGIGVKEG